MFNLRTQRAAIGISQSRLARISRVSRFKIVGFELGDTTLTQEELVRIRAALHAEVLRLRNIDIAQFERALGPE